MEAKMHLCAALIDKIDEIFANTLTGTSYQRPVLSASRDAGLRNANQQSLKNRLLTEMRECFVEKNVCSLRLSTILLFCHNHGFKLVTHYIKKNERASFFIRTNSFDLIVEYTS